MILGLEEYVEESLGKLILGARGNEAKEKESIERVKRRRLEAKIKQKEKKLLHGQHFREKEYVKSIDTCLWLREGTMKVETESLFMAPQS